MDSISVQPVKVFIGFDSRERLAYHVLSYSLIKYCSRPIAIYPLKKELLSSIYTRERDPGQSTDFTFTRFLVPYLCEYMGWAIYMDCDIICKGDISELWDRKGIFSTILCVHHDQYCDQDIKFLGQRQQNYKFKNWASVMLMNCQHCKKLTPEYVAKASPMELLQFGWIKDHTSIGKLPTKFNYLVGHSKDEENSLLIHYTNGGPWISGYENCERAEDWFKELDDMHSNEQ